MPNVPVQHVYYVDDDPDDIEVFASAIKEVSPGTQLTAVSSCKLLLTALETLPGPDVIVCDVNLGPGNGVDCLREIKSFPQYGHIPVVLYSTTMVSRQVEDATKLGAAYYAVKASNWKELLAFATRVCELDFERPASIKS